MLVMPAGAPFPLPTTPPRFPLVFFIRTWYIFSGDSNFHFLCLVRVPARPGPFCFRVFPRVQQLRAHTQPQEKVRVVQGNALDLSAFPNGTYDITLLLGPLYHLYTVADKRKALQEAIRVTKPGGIIFVAYVISDGCLLDEGFHRNHIDVAQYIKDGLLDADTFAANSAPKDLFELVRKEDIDYLMSVFPTTRLHYVATDGCALFMREAIDNMDDNTFQLYLKYHLATCEREDLIGITSHALDIFMK